MDLYEKLGKYNYPLKSGLVYKNEFTFLVAIILSAQAKDEFVNQKTKELFQYYDTPEKILDLGSCIFEYIKSIGLWRNKGSNILKMSAEIIELKRQSKLKNWYENFFDSFQEEDLKLHDSSYLSKEFIPTFRAGLLSLSGVGRKSANVFLNVIYNAPYIPVDTHVKRVANRLGLVDTLDPLKIEQALELIVPVDYKSKISHYLVWHGRKICNAKKPKCNECLLKNDCIYYHQNI